MLAAWPIQIVATSGERRACTRLPERERAIPWDSGSMNPSTNRNGRSGKRWVTIVCATLSPLWGSGLKNVTKGPLAPAS